MYAASLSPSARIAARNGGDERVRVAVDEHRPAERDPERDARIERRDEAPEEDLHEHRRAAEEPDVDPARPRDERVRRQAHDGEHDAERDADRHRDDGELERQDEAAEDPGVEEVVADRPPLEARVRRDRVGDGDEDEQQDGRRDPPPRAAHRDGLDLLRPDGLRRGVAN